MLFLFDGFRQRSRRRVRHKGLEVCNPLIRQNLSYFKAHKNIIFIIFVIFATTSKAPFTLLRFCCDPFLFHRCYPFTLLRLCTKTEGKTSVFIPNTEPKISVFVRSHCSGSVKLIVEYWSVSKKLRFCAFTLIQSVFKNLRFVDIHFR